MDIKKEHSALQNRAVSLGQASRWPRPSEETHRIALLPQNCFQTDSEGLHWGNLYASLATEHSWAANLPAVEHHCLAYCVSNAATITRRFDGDSNFQTGVLRARRLGVIPARRSSEWSFSGSADVLLLYLHQSMIDRLACELLDHDSSQVDLFPLLGKEDPLLEQLALAALSELRTRKPESSLYVDTLAQTIAVRLIHAHSGTGRQVSAALDKETASQGGLDRAIDFIESSLDADLRLATLAEEAGMSPFYFARAFKKKTGESPHQFLIRRRIERAKGLLASTRMEVAEIAFATGFSSQSHLAATFKRNVGMTPGDFRGRRRPSDPTH